MQLPPNKTKIVATIGPASDDQAMLERLIRAGMNVARLNFSHRDFPEHKDRIARIRASEKATGIRVTIMADLPGPKMRIGKLKEDWKEFASQWLDEHGLPRQLVILMAGPSRQNPDANYRVEFLRLAKEAPSA